MTTTIFRRFQIPIAIALAVALLAGLLGSQAVLAQSPTPQPGAIAAQRGLGQITTISGSQFTVKKSTGEEQTYSVNSSTRLQSLGGTELAFADLKVGDWVFAVGTPGSVPQPVSAAALARLVVVLPDSFDPSRAAAYLGQVAGVNAGQGQFSLQTPLNGEKTVSINRDTRFLGGIKNLADLVNGMRAWIFGEKESDGKVTAMAVRANYPAAKNVGQITAVDTTANTFTLHTRWTGEDLTFTVDQATHFRGISGSNLSSLADLQPGMAGLVISRGSSATNEPAAATALIVIAGTRQQWQSLGQRVAGRVTSVGSDSFTVETRLGQSATIQVGPQTRFLSLDGKIKGLQDLQAGMTVIAASQPQASGQLQATAVFVAPRLF